MPNFTQSVQRLGYRTPKTEIFTEIWSKCEYKRPTGAYPLRDFHKICRVCTPFQDALAVKNSLDLLKGLRSYGVLSWRGLVIPKYLAPLAAKLCVRPPKVLEVQERARGPLITVPSLVGLGFHPPPGWPKTLSFLSVCLSVTLLNVRDCAPDFAMKALEYRNDFILMPLDRGRFVVVHPCSTLSDNWRQH